MTGQLALQVMKVDEKQIILINLYALEFAKKYVLIVFNLFYNYRMSKILNNLKQFSKLFGNFN